jgi:hypothetical protein
MRRFLCWLCEVLNGRAYAWNLRTLRKEINAVREALYRAAHEVHDPDAREPLTIRGLRAARQRPDAPGDAWRRVTVREAGVQAYRDTLAKFAPITAENFQAAADFQERRLAELLRGGRP